MVLEGEHFERLAEERRREQEAMGFAEVDVNDAWRRVREAARGQPEDQPVGRKRGCARRSFASGRAARLSSRCYLEEGEEVGEGAGLKGLIKMEAGQTAR